MVDKTSKEHEIRVLESVFKNSTALFDELGYSGFVFKQRKECNGVPDGFFENGKATIWVEHTEAKPNYRKKGERLSGFEGFCEDVRKALSSEIKGCVCCDIPSSVAEFYLGNANYKKDFLNIIRNMVNSDTKDYEDIEKGICLKYCSIEECKVELASYKGLRIIHQGVHNLEFCKTIPLSVYEMILASKEVKYKGNPSFRNENWLFIEIPFGYTFDDEYLPMETGYFDKVFMLNKFDYSAKLIATKKIDL